MRLIHSSYHLTSSHPLLSPHPHLLFTALNVAQLCLPDFESVVTSVAHARKQVKRPAVLGAGDAGAENDAEIFNVEGCAV